MDIKEVSKLQVGQMVITPEGKGKISDISTTTNTRFDGVPYVWIGVFANGHVSVWASCSLRIA